MSVSRALALVGLMALSTGPLAPAVAAGAAAAGGAATFPLAVQPGRRHLVDASGRPFLVQGDTAWSLIAELRREDVERYLDDRRARGFNTVLVSLLEHRFSSRAPANAFGEAPFLTPGDFGTPNDAYFDHAAWVVQQAAARDLLVLLTPSYLGYDGGNEGWYQEMIANGPDKLRGYGRYVGRRFGDRRNVLWIQGGDFNPPDRDIVRAIADGIGEQDPDALQSAHAAPETSALDYWRGEPWLQVNTVYSYRRVQQSLAKAYADPSRLPFFLIESFYENEHGVTQQELRAQAYRAVLAGSTGQVFGNNPIWHFSGPGLHPARLDWQRALGSGGARSMTHLNRFLTGLRWWLLQPDTAGGFLTSGRGDGGGRAASAVAADRSFAVVYLPTGRGISVDLGELAGPLTRARWYDPAAGRLHQPVEPESQDKGVATFRPPGDDASGSGDWVLLLETSA